VNKALRLGLQKFAFSAPQGNLLDRQAPVNEGQKQLVFGVIASAAKPERFI
jgi:hypothetical protein